MNFYNKKCNNERVNNIINNEQMHNIFQPILKVDHCLNAKTDSYEMLLRNSAGVFPGLEFLRSLATEEGNQQWITASRQSLDEVLPGHRNSLVYINLEPCQLGFENVWQFLKEVHTKYSQQVAIEITERREKVHNLDYLDDGINRLNALGFEVAIDDVCAGGNSYAFIVRQLAAIRRIKLSLLLFRGENQETVVDFVRAWHAFASAHHLEFVVEGVANKQIAEDLAASPTMLQQGNYWGKGNRQLS